MTEKLALKGCWCPIQTPLGWVRTKFNCRHPERSAKRAVEEPPHFFGLLFAGCPTQALLGWVCAITLVLGSLPSPAQPASHEISVLAASDLQPILPALADRFEHESGIKVVARYGSSSTLTTQIQNGAPADLFLAADYSFPEQLVAAHLADSPAPLPYARGALVLWARKDSPLQPLTQNTLRENKFTSLAIANPDHAPYGRAAVAALTWMKLYDAIKPKIVQAENITQTTQFVESGNAQLGLISLTSASTAHMQQVGSFVRIPTQTYPEIRQCAVVLLKSQHSADAHHFLDWLRSPAVQKTLQNYGLDPVQ